MKKIFYLFFIFIATIFVCIFAQNCANAINYGAYKPESDYGLIDGFKFNGFFNREEGVKMFQLKSETKEEKARIEREKNMQKEEQDENEQYRLMREGTVTY